MLGCLALFSFQFSRASSSPETQYCGNKKFYCPENSQCYDRTLRCISAKVCLDSNGNEAKCYESGRAGMYNYYKKRAPLISGPSRRKKRFPDPKHWFVEYRGFVYEYGGSYGLQELDVNDPNYKYGPGREKVGSEELRGSSSCTRDQIIRFKDEWIEANPDYSLVFNNCQHFAEALLRELENNCSNSKRDLKAQCSVTSAAMPRMIFNWELYALFGPLISFAIQHFN